MNKILQILIVLLFSLLFLSCKKDDNNSLEPAITIGSNYYVYGGSLYIADTSGYHPERHGYTQLGFDTLTATYMGTYRYYIIVTYTGSAVRIDAVQGSNGQYFGTYTTGNAIDYQNIDGPPDGLYALIGGQYSNVGGYVLIDATGTNISSIRVIVIPE
jgi:hypothetical protein